MEIIDNKEDADEINLSLMDILEASYKDEKNGRVAPIGETFRSLREELK